MAFVTDFREGVRALVRNERPKIIALTQMAGEHKRSYAVDVVDIIVQRIAHVLASFLFSSASFIRIGIYAAYKMSNQFILNQCPLSLCVYVCLCAVAVCLLAVSFK